jgi:predicted ATPase/DNA-binding winged helix-turn-helix (wHTH) protein
LTKDGAPVMLAARTFDTLVALVSRAGQRVSKQDLLAEIWPDVVVDENTLRFHVSALRKALGDGRDGARYIATLPSRGYCFVAPVTQSNEWANSNNVESFSHANLPVRLTTIVGRDDDVARLCDQLISARLVSIVGTGGVGKTTVGVAVGHQLMTDFAGAVLFVDLGMLSDPELVASTVASQLGLAVQSADPTPNLIAHLRDRRLFLILDTCEHLIEAVARLVSQIFVAAPRVYILTTSREPLRVEQERVYRLDSLACPPDDAGVTAAVAQTFPATQLFIERAVASGVHLNISDAEAPIVADICRKLDGVALAIELAARRIGTYGLQQTAALLDQNLKLAWSGLRTAPPRQRTLQATLDWSYRLLSSQESLVLRRLAVFVGYFTLDAAMEVVADAALSPSSVLGAIDGLVAKSMIATREIGAMMRYRLLDATRAYALESSTDEDKPAELAARHANYYRRWLQQTGSAWSTLTTGAERVPHFAGLNNVRAALEWCFGPTGNTRIGVELAAAAARVFFAMSLMNECHRWSAQALLALDEASVASREEMQLQATLGMSLMLRHGRPDEALAALNRSLAIAEQRGDPLDQLHLLGPLQTFHLRTGSCEAALECGRRASALAEATGDPGALVLAHSLLGIALHHMGNLGASRTEHEAALRTASQAQSSNARYHGFNGELFACDYLARTSWLQGYPLRAAEFARQAVTDARRVGHPLTMSVVLYWAITMYLWLGDLGNAEEYLSEFTSLAASHAFSHYLAVGHGFEAILDIRRGNTDRGVKRLQSRLAELDVVRNQLLTKDLSIALVQGLVVTGRFAEALALVDDTSRTNGEALYVPELLRVKAGILLSMPLPQIDEAHAYLRQAIELSREQGARAWELRAATDLTASLAGQGRAEEGLALLRPIFEQFTEGLETPDLKAAKQLLDGLASVAPHSPPM